MTLYLPTKTMIIKGDSSAASSKNLREFVRKTIIGKN